MAGVLAQANATLTKVAARAALSDSFSETPEEGEAKWEGRRGAWIPTVASVLESSTSGRDEIKAPRVICPAVCSIEIGDLLELEQGGESFTWKVSGVSLRGQGVEVGAGQTYDLQIEVS